MVIGSAMVFCTWSSQPTSYPKREDTSSRGLAHQSVRHGLSGARPALSFRLAVGCFGGGRRAPHGAMR